MTDEARTTAELLDALDEQLHKHRELAAEHARVADFAAKVHDDAAELHEGMDSPLMDPVALREHAEECRQEAARERAIAAGDQASEGSAHG